MSTSSNLILDTNEEPGYCSIAPVPLNRNQVWRILNCAEAAKGSSSPRGITVFTEKSLGLKGKRQLLFIDNVLVEYAGVRKAKFVTKDAQRYENMVNEAVEKLGVQDHTVMKVILLGVEQQICRKNTLKRLHHNGVIVMRCPNPEETETEDESD